jgi:hypothetical protein
VPGPLAQWPRWCSTNRHDVRSSTLSALAVDRWCARPALPGDTCNCPSRWFPYPGDGHSVLSSDRRGRALKPVRSSSPSLRQWWTHQRPARW